MGVQGLLPLVKPYMTKRHLSHYKGKTAAIDTFCWLHRGAIPDCKDLAYKRSTPDTARYIPYVFKYSAFENDCFKNVWPLKLVSHS